MRRGNCDREATGRIRARDTCRLLELFIGEGFDPHASWLRVWRQQHHTAEWLDGVNQVVSTFHGMGISFRTERRTPPYSWLEMLLLGWGLYAAAADSNSGSNRLSSHVESRRP